MARKLLLELGFEQRSSIMNSKEHALTCSKRFFGFTDFFIQ